MREQRTDQQASTSGTARWSRRRVLGGGAVAGGVWLAPQVLTGTAAVAQVSPLPGPGFVAVGNSGRRITSTDGITWTNDQTGGNDLYGVTHANGTFVAVGFGGRRIRSTDGITWTNDQTGGDALFGVAHGG